MEHRSEPSEDTAGSIQLLQCRYMFDTSSLHGIVWRSPKTDAVGLTLRPAAKDNAAM